MELKLKLDKGFTTEFNRMKEKYGDKFAKLNGFSDANLTFTDFIDNFIDNDVVADATIDPNANSSSHDMPTLLNDMVKPLQKLLGANKIFYELNKKYGYKTACEWLEMEWNGSLYLHDFATSSFKSYCFAYDLEKMVNDGLWFVEDFNGGAPKHLDTFNNDVLEFVSWTSNRTSGKKCVPFAFFPFISGVTL